MGCKTSLQASFTRNIDLFQRHFQKMPCYPSISRGSILSLPYYRLTHLNSHLRPDSHKQDSIYSRSILMVFYARRREVIHHVFKNNEKALAYKWRRARYPPMRLFFWLHHPCCRTKTVDEHPEPYSSWHHAKKSLNSFDPRSTKEFIAESRFLSIRMVLRTQERWRTTTPYRSSDTQYVTIEMPDLPPIIDNFIEPFWTLSILWIRLLSVTIRTNTPSQESWPHRLSNTTCLLRIHATSSFTNPCRVSELHNVHPTGRIPHQLELWLTTLVLKDHQLDMKTKKANSKHPRNDGIRCSFGTCIVINRVLHRLAHAGATNITKEVSVARPRITLVGQTPPTMETSWYLSNIQDSQVAYTENKTEVRDS